MSINSPGLYVVATPIGNLEDITYRAVHILQDVSLILAEDTRHSSKLLQHYGIHTPVQAFHDHNEQHVITAVIKRMCSGQSIALISDAGTPLISDPGYKLVAAVHAAGLDIVPVPGPSALVCALSVAGLPTDRFVFEGFLPNRQQARKTRLSELANEKRTLVFYEVPHRICNCLEDMISCFGAGRSAVIAKELTKKHEVIQKDTLENLLAWLTGDEVRLKGEFVLLVQGTDQAGAERTEMLKVLEILLQKVSIKDATQIAAGILGVNKNKLYKLALEITEGRKKHAG